MKVCNSCGAQNEDSTRFCTTCGTAFNGPAPVPAPEPAPAPDPYQSTYQPVMMNSNPATFSALAVTGFVISIVSIFCCGLTAPLGLIFSIAGLFAAARKDKKGLGLAIAGTIISGLGTLFIILCLVVSWSAIQTAYKEAENGDYQEFFEILEQELEEMDSEYSSGSSGSLRDNRNTSDDDSQQFSSDWVDCEVSEDMTTIEIVYTNGIPDDFEFCGADFDEICDALEDNLTSEDNFGQTASFDREEFRRLLSIVLINSEEYDSMNLSRGQVLDMLSYLAALSCEMDNDGFEPDRAVYTEATNAYDFYGIIEPNNIGHAVVVFTDGTDSYYFDEAMCGDEICWSMVPGTYDVFRIGMTADSLNEYPAGGFAEFASWVSSILDPVI